MLHRGVMTTEVIAMLNPQAGESIVDCTLGGGDHSKAILQRLQGGKLSVFDVDQTAINSFKQWLLEQGKQLDNNRFQLSDNEIQLFHQDFATLSEHFSNNSVDSVLADLGYSTDQFSTVSGLSYKQQGELDMRISASEQSPTATALLALLPEQQLTTMWQNYADLRPGEAHAFSKAIASTRKSMPIATTTHFNELISRFFALNEYAPRLYQALRIAVNDELGKLRDLIQDAHRILKADGKLVILTFHSGEETVLTNAVKTGTWQHQAFDNVIGQPGLKPTVKELRANLPSRSAKLWCLTKV